jgi:L-ascorbate metabolism protein UlaG (beta-lactamase superfamily)
MKIQFIRNATMRIEYAGQHILTDPCLAEKGSLPSYAGRSTNPTAALPLGVEQILDRIDAVLVSHLHKDHFDPTARDAIPKDTPVFCRGVDTAALAEHRFGDLRPVDNDIQNGDLKIQAVAARHGSSRGVLRDMGTTCGYVLTSENEPSVYWIGDSVWYGEIEATIAKQQPDVMITHSGGAVWNENELIIMDAEQTVKACRAAPGSRVVAIHLEAFDHCMVTREDLREKAREAGIPDDRLLIPADGEKFVINHR